MKLKKVLLSGTFIIFAFCSLHGGQWGAAQWIWQQEDGPSNAWVSFRKAVQIDELPDVAEANIAVDSKFWLWINGELVVFEGGMARGPSPAGPWDRENKITPSNSWYETVDLQPYLVKGKNTIAVLAWYWGRETHKGTHIDSKKGGLLFYAQIGDQALVSDSTWKAIQHPGYDDTVEPASKNLVQYSVGFDARKAMNDWSEQAWYSKGFSDTEWPDAVEKGAAGTAPWHALEKNFVPRLSNHGLQNYDNHEDLRLPFESDGTTIRCKLPFNKQITPYLEVEADAVDTIFITTDNRLNLITATYITKAGHQSFESFSWMNGNEVIYTIPAGVKVKALKYRWMSVGEMAGEFEVDDPFYNRLWWMGNNTLFVCARDNFMDCPDRERALWIGDVADQTGYLFYSMDHAGRQLLKKAILQTVYFSQDDVLGALGPLRVRELVTQSLQFIAQTVWPYYLNTGDIETLKIAYPYVYAYLDLFPMQDNGLPEYRIAKSPDSWDWLDWGEKNTIDNEPIQMAFYYLALDKAREMAGVLGNKEHVKWYNERMESMKPAYNNAFWKDGFYSSDAEKFKDDRANAIAIVSGIAYPEYYDHVVDNVLIPNRFSSPHFEWMVEEAMCIAGRHQESLQRMKEQYQSQVANADLSTLYEMFPKGGTYNHAWNAPNTILSKYIAGVVPTGIAWSEYQIKPALAHFTGFKKTIPTVKGKITMETRKTANCYRLNLSSPPNTTATVYLPTNDQVKVNGKVIWKKRKFKNRISQVKIHEVNDAFIVLKVKPGVWKFEASNK